MEPRIVTNDYLIDASFFFEQSKDAIFIIDQHKLIDTNQAGVELLGLKDRDDVADDGVFKLIKDQKGNDFSLLSFIKQLNNYPHQNKVFQFITRYAFFWVEISNTIYEKDDQKLLFSIWRDITESKQLEITFQSNEKKLNEALRLANCATWEYDFEKDAFVISKGMVDIIGVRHQCQIIDQDRYLVPIAQYKKLIHPDDHKVFNRTRKKIINNEVDNYIDHTEYRIIHPDGQIRYLYATTRVSLEKDGNLLKHHGTVQDVTEIHKIEGELSKSREQLSDALTIANLSTWELDRTTDCMKMGENFVKMLGEGLPVKKGNIIAVDDFINLIHPDDLHTYYMALDKAAKSRAKDYIDFIEYRIVRPDNEIRNIYISIKVQKDDKGNHLRHFGTIQDITPIREAIAEKERFGTIIEATSDIVLMLDKQLNLIYLNQAARDFYGFSPEDNVAGFPIKILQSEHSQKLTRDHAIPLAASQGIWSGENVIQRYDKELITVSQVIISHKGVDGEVEYYSSIIRDISDQKQIEQDLKYKNKELDTFVYKASHDLRGPIASLLGLYRIVENEITDEKSLEYFDLYNKQITRLNDIILTLIQLTKIKEVDIKREEIDFKDVVNSCINSFTNLPNFENVRFNISVDLEWPFISDRGLITTILQNLVENAIKYSKPGQLSDVEVAIKRNLNDDLLIKVEDHGIGIEKNIQGEVFNMFFRANDQVIGSGLGLYILKNAVEKLNGKVSLYSKVNEGTTFSIKLKDEPRP
ncbi:PAS domain S-box protein [Fulvivirgaceae bacterium BMA12]|uniref:histidine kinase n=1 Tax=Agaribacillus aureus TaxID=3051825 RepID=A0ABT8L763_9BACT|nr:PAS domain S-box protein [Fulvivirgaceae bacterium BMA12]